MKLGGVDFLALSNFTRKTAADRLCALQGSVEEAPNPGNPPLANKMPANEVAVVVVVGCLTLRQAYHEWEG